MAENNGPDFLPNFLNDYHALRAANDALREQGIHWLVDSLSRLCADTNRARFARAGDQATEIRTGLRPCEFRVENATMVGEALGLRSGMNTLLIETGWPREPKHGFVSGGGLARGRVRMSPNPTIDANLIAEIILKKDPAGQPVWYVVSGSRVPEPVSAATLQNWFALLLRD
ncbi:MAG: hypothetical protein ACKV2V_06625 [Blastocatellia bacterium]